MILKSLMSFLGSLGFERWIYYIAIVGLAIMLTLKTCKVQKVQNEIANCNVVTIEFDSLKNIVATEYIHRDEAPKGDTIIEEVAIIVADTARLARYWLRWNESRQRAEALAADNEKLLAELDELDYHNRNLTAWFQEDETIPKPLPLIRTVKESNEDDHDLKIVVDSRGQLEKFDFDLKVHPKIIKTQTKETVYTSKPGVVGIGGGVISLQDSPDLNLTTGVLVGYKWMALEADIIWTKDFKYEGFQVGAKALIKYK